MAKNKLGRPYKYTPAEFELAWQQYFQWVDNNPWMKAEAIKSGELAGSIMRVPRDRPYTERGFCAFHCLGKNYLNQLATYLEGKQDKTSKELAWVVTRARARCKSQKFEGAAVGAFNASIIARDLGLIDKKEQAVTVTGVEISVKRNRN